MRRHLRAALAMGLVGLLGGALACSDDGEGQLDGSTITLPEGGANCGPSNCVGCCTSSGACLPVASNTYCGSGGNVCISCQNDEICSQGQCIKAGKCSQSSCPNGCCKGDKCMGGSAKDACGSGGQQCSECSTTQLCKNKWCACDPSKCSGCCDGASNTCKPGNESGACGKSGQACKKCGSAQICKEGACATGDKCSASNCATGCCDGDTCKTGGTVAACGKGGQACKQCKAGEKCDNGVCNDPAQCGPSNCATGCCSSGKCLSGTSINECGSGGGVCSACVKSQVCKSGKCKLDPSSKWNITIVSASYLTSKKWDWPAYTEPDSYVEATVGASTGKTTPKNNTYTPYWNELVLTVTAGSLESYGMTLKVYDDDWPSDELMGSCKATIPENVLLSGSGVKTGCGQYIKSIKFSFSSN